MKIIATAFIITTTALALHVSVQGDGTKNGVTATTAATQTVGDRPNLPAIAAPPAAEVERLNLSPFYKKYLSAGGFPIVASDKVDDRALYEAHYLIKKMLEDREDIRNALIDNKVRFSIMAVDELTTNIPEHSDLKPGKYWDRRARGLGASRRRPSVSCGEENLLRYPGDPYHEENILIHEFAHAIHLMGLNAIDREFDRKLRAAYEAAMEKGLWKGKYAANNKQEYWAEAVQSWFDTNRKPDHDHNHVDTREELKEYDPAAAKLCEEIFGDKPWRYVRPEERKDALHMQGYDPNKSPKFEWPAELVKWYAENGKKAEADLFRGRYRQNR